MATSPTIPLPAFYTGQLGPEYITRLNQMFEIWLQALEESVGPQGWSPVPALEVDGERVLMKIVNWIAGEGTAPTVLGYMGATGLVTNKAQAIDVRGAIGQTGPSNVLVKGTVTTGAPGTDADIEITGVSPSQTLNITIPRGNPGVDGDDGNNGWTAMHALVPDGTRIVEQVVDWAGGTGAKPAVGMYIGPEGFVSLIGDATDVRGAPGANGTGTGDVIASGSFQVGDIPVVSTTDGKTLVTSFKKIGELASLDDVEEVSNNLLNYVPLSQRGVANGVATLDADGKLPFAQVPAVAISVPYVVNSQAAQLALTAQVGDTAIRTDISTNYIHNGGTTGTMSDWTALLVPTQVTWDSLPGKPAVIAAGATTTGAINALGYPVAQVVLARLSSGLPTGISYRSDAATASSIAQRDANGRIKAADGTDPDHVVTKAQLDANSGVLTGDAILTARNLTAPAYLDFNTVYPISSYPDLYALLGQRQDVLPGNSGFTTIPSYTPTSAEMLTETVGVASFSSTQYGYSTDGGQTWTASASVTSNVSKVWRLGPTHAASTGGAASNARYTSDGGVTWALYSPTLGWIPIEFIVDGTTVVAVQTATNVYRSTDNGATWSAAIATGVAATQNAAAYDGKRIIITVGSSAVRYSDDLGVTWAAGAAIPGTGGTPSSMVAVSPNVFVVLTTSGYLYVTYNGGMGWILLAQLGTTSMTLLKALDEKTLVAINSGGTVVWQSDDFGQSWFNPSPAWPTGAPNTVTLSPLKKVLLKGSNRSVPGMSYGAGNFITPPAPSVTPTLKWKIKS